MAARLRVGRVPTATSGKVRGTAVVAESVAYARPSETRDYKRIRQCAQECARTVLAIGMHQVAELVVHHWLTGDATVFQTGIIVIAPSQENSPNPQVLAARILTRLR